MLGGGIYEKQTNEKKNRQKSDAKNRAWELNSKQFPISFFISSTKNGSFWSALYDAVEAMERDGKTGKVQIDGVENVFSINSENFNQVFYESVIPAIISAGGAVVAEVVEKKKIVRPAQVRLISE